MQPKCDFCGTNLVFGESWRFKCADFSIDKPNNRVQEYEGDWGACPTCKNLIVAGKRDELAQRAANAALQGAPSGVSIEFAEQSAREIQDGFWSNRRVGPPALDTKEEWDEPVEPPRYEDR